MIVGGPLTASEWHIICGFLQCRTNELWNRVGRAQRVITRDPDRKIYSSDPDNPESMTGIESISGDGEVLPSILIIPRILHLEKWYFEGGLATNTGYTNDDISLNWLRYLDKYNSKRQIGA